MRAFVCQWVGTKILGCYLKLAVLCWWLSRARYTAKEINVTSYVLLPAAPIHKMRGTIHWIRLEAILPYRIFSAWSVRAFRFAVSHSIQMALVVAIRCWQPSEFRLRETLSSTINLRVNLVYTPFYRDLECTCTPSRITAWITAVAVFLSSTVISSLGLLLSSQQYC